MNIGVCATVVAVKYSQRYIYKDCDQTTIGTDGFEHEAERHLTRRFIGPTQAAWQLWESPTHEEFHALQHLPAHLPNEQPVYFGATANVDELQIDWERLLQVDGIL